MSWVIWALVGWAIELWVIIKIARWGIRAAKRLTTKIRHELRGAADDLGLGDRDRPVRPSSARTYREAKREARAERRSARRASRNSSIPAQDVIIEDVEPEYVDTGVKTSANKTSDPSFTQGSGHRPSSASVRSTKSGGPAAPAGYGASVHEASSSAASASSHAQPEIERPDYVRLPDNASIDRIREVLAPYHELPVVGPYAIAARDTLRDATNRRASLFAELDATFERSSLSWAHFAEPAEAVLETIRANSVVLANRLQNFDITSYLRLGDAVRTSALPADDARSERLKLLRETLSSLDAIQQANDRLLLELEKLSFELAQLSAAEAEEETQALLDDIRTLVEQAKFYKQ